MFKNHKNKTVITHPKVNVGPVEDKFEPKEWFTNTTYYEYYNNFMQGLDLDSVTGFTSAIAW